MEAGNMISIDKLEVLHKQVHDQLPHIILPFELQAETKIVFACSKGDFNWAVVGEDFFITWPELLVRMQNHIAQHNPEDIFYTACV